MENKHLCDGCALQEGCKHYDNIKDQPKLTLVCCEHFKRKGKSSKDEVQGLQEV